MHECKDRTSKQSQQVNKFENIQLKCDFTFHKWTFIAIDAWKKNLSFQLYFLTCQVADKTRYHIC